MIAASVVLLPLPVTPVTSTSPRDSSASLTTDGGRPSSRAAESGRNQAHRHGDRAALAEDAGADAADARRLPGDVDFELGLQPLLMHRRQQARGDGFEVRRR